MTRSIFHALVLPLLGLLAAPAHADITGVTGGIVVISPPTSVVLGDLEGDSHMFLFREGAGVALSAPILVDVTAPGAASLQSELTSGVIPAGVAVDSFYLHHDQVGTARNYNAGTVSFDTEVLGIIVLVPSLLDSNAPLGAPGTLYGSVGQAQGLELVGSCSGDPGDGTTQQDSVALSADRHTVSFCSNVYGFPDDIRIITISPFPVVIDIKPGSFPNSINRMNHGVVPVAMLGGDRLNLSFVDLDTVQFAGASPSHVASEDVNGDGIPDIIMQFVTAETNLGSGDTVACLTGHLIGGRPFKGCDSVRIVK